MNTTSVTYSQRCYRRAFTLVETLVVLGVIMILVGIFMGIQRYVYVEQARTRARAELHVIANALEQFKLIYGDYPYHDSNFGRWTGSDESKTNQQMFYALTGRLTMRRNPADGSIVMEKYPQDFNYQKRIFLEQGRFTVSADERLVDPWGNPYFYHYRWSNMPNLYQIPGFLLYSMGPSGRRNTSSIGNDGIIPLNYPSQPNNEDNIFYGYYE